MKIELWHSQESEHAHEVRALERLLTDLRDEDWDDFCLVCANFFCVGEQIDLMIVKRHAVVVIELKDASGRLEGGENGDWLLTDSTGNRVRLNPGRRNPYQQARAMRYAVAEFLIQHSARFMAAQKALQLDFMHVAAVVAFTDYDPASVLDLPHAPWFSALGLRELVRELRVRRSPMLDFSIGEARALVKDVLRLRQAETDKRPVDIAVSERVSPPEEPAPLGVAEMERQPIVRPCVVCGEERRCAVPHLAGTVVSSSVARPLDQLNLVVFDVETTGIDASAGDRVVEVGAIMISKGEVTSEFRELVYSGVPVGDTVDVHGYTDEFLREHGKAPAEVFPRFVGFIGEDPLAAHHLSFDLSFVNSELALLGMSPLQNATIDTLSLARRVLPQLNNHKMGTVAQYFDIPLEDAHHALADVKATWRILEELARIAENAGLSVDPERTIRFTSTEARGYDIRMINHWAEVPRQVQLLLNSRMLGVKGSEGLILLHHLLHDPKDPGHFLAARESLVVIEPDWLVEVRSLVVVGACDRQYLVRRFTPRGPSEKMLVGALAHRCFEAILRDPEDDGALGDAFYEGAQQLALDLITVNSDEDSIAPTVRRHAKILTRWAKEMPFRGQRSPETFVFSPELGLKGVIDALWKDETGHPTAMVELKTGTPPWQAEPWGGDALQAAAYGLMLKARAPRRQIEAPIVLYTGGRQTEDSSGTEKRVSVTPEMAGAVVGARNRVLVADYCLEALDTGVLPCPKCWSKDGCSVLSLLADGWPDVESSEDWEPPSFADEDRRFFAHYATLLAREYIAFKQSHQTLWKDDAKKREDEGTAVHVSEIEEPVEVEGGFLYVMPCDNRSELREGEFVVLSDGDPAGSSRLVTGIVDAARRQAIAVRTGIRLAFDSAWVDSYSGERLLESDFHSLYDWMVSKPPDARRMVIGNDPVPRFGVAQDVPSRPKLGDKPLNEKQKEALMRALAMEDYLLIEGPPGSGKTVLIGALAKAFIGEGQRVLLAANTNQALDKAILALMDQDLGDLVVRLGSELRVTDDRVKSRLLRKLPDSAERGRYVEEFRELLETTPIVAATVARWQTFPRILAQDLFDLAIVDEATQITVPSALGVLRHVDRFVLLGDPNQLPPIVLQDDDQSRKTGVGEVGFEVLPLSLSLFEILLDKLESSQKPHGIVNLEDQYRMNDTICRFPSQQWYGGKLRAAAKAVGRGEIAMLAQYSEEPWSEVLDPERHVIIIDVPGSAGAGYMPRTNSAEATVVSEIVLAARRGGARPEDMSVITPYRAQVAWIRRELEKGGDGLLSGDEIRGMVDTVDRFQGEERAMVIVSFATYGRTLSDHLKNQRRLNVALTRAKHKLVLVGDRQVLSQDDLYARLFSIAGEDDAHTMHIRWVAPREDEFTAF